MHVHIMYIRTCTSSCIPQVGRSPARAVRVKLTGCNCVEQQDPVSEQLLAANQRLRVRLLDRVCDRVLAFAIDVLVGGKIIKLKLNFK